jgi:hypothetical protein
MPAHHGLRVAVQQKHGLAAARRHGIDTGARGLDATLSETLEKCHAGPPLYCYLIIGEVLVQARPSVISWFSEAR